MCNNLLSKKSDKPAFIGNTPAEPIVMFVMPAFCNRDLSFSIRADCASQFMTWHFKGL